MYIEPVRRLGWRAVAKRVFDVVIATTFLVFAAPVIAIAALAIKLDTRGPVFFVQSRHGYNHRVIRVFKFRTMTVMEVGPIVVQAQRNDERTTRVGRVLRRTSLDELPQLINVVRGELSLVGPRPHAVAHNHAYAALIENYASRHKIKPGITGWAQVNGFRGETRDPELMRRRVHQDLWYLDNWSLWLDLRILIKTMKVPFDRDVY
jgi:exopolysaccharide biosynthesis polyprenyl glycosylphosphotransferase